MGQITSGRYSNGSHSPSARSRRAVDESHARLTRLVGDAILVAGLRLYRRYWVWARQFPALPANYGQGIHAPRFFLVIAIIFQVAPAYTKPPIWDRFFSFQFGRTVAGLAIVDDGPLLALVS